jgi:predicted membrane protein
MRTKYLGPTAALLCFASPLIFLGIFEARIFDQYWHGAMAYTAGLLLLGLCIISCLLCPIVGVVWLMVSRDKFSSGIAIIALVSALLSVAILYFDPGHHIYRFVTD